MKNRERIFKVTMCAITAALSIAMNFLKIDLGFARLTFYALPLMFTGIVFGTCYGTIAGIVTGIVLQLVSEYGIGITSPVWALAPIAWGFFSGLLNKLLTKLPRLARITLVVTITSIIAYLFNTLAFVADYYAYGYANYNMISRLLALPFTIVVYSACLYFLDKRKHVFIAFSREQKADDK